MRKAPKLTFPKTCMTAKSYESACDYPNETFEKTTANARGQGIPAKGSCMQTGMPEGF